MHLSSASFSYPQHHGPDRAELARRLTESGSVEDGLVLATCLRLEVVVPGDISHLDGVLSGLFGVLPGGVEPLRRDGERAVTHLFRVAAGLESPILGEAEILTQFRQTLLQAEESGQVTGLLARLLETAVSVGRQARELIPGSPHNSMAAVAAQAIGLADRVAVLGSGIMATAVAQGLLQLPAPPAVTVVARQPEKVAVGDFVEVWPFQRAAEALSSFPAVISATSAQGRLVDDATMSLAFARRTTPLTLVDMAMPPDFRPERSSMVSYIDIDALAMMADRRPRTLEADSFVESAASDAYRQYRDHHEVAPLIEDLMRSADEIVDRTVGRFAGKLGSPADESVLRQAAHTVARTLLAGPVSYVKQADPEIVDVVADVFGVVDE